MNWPSSWATALRVRGLGQFLFCLSFATFSHSVFADPCGREIGRVQKVILTGGPSSGKSALVERLKVVAPHLALVPETATILLSGGFPKPRTPAEVRIFQSVFPGVQDHLERMIALRNPDARVMIMDRVVMDGYGFWPGDLESFLEAVNLKLEPAMQAYDWVVFFQMPDEKDFGGNNPFRFHNYAQSVAVSARLEELWSKHPNFIMIPTTVKFDLKIQIATEVIQMIEAGRTKSEIDEFMRTR